MKKFIILLLAMVMLCGYQKNKYDSAYEEFKNDFANEYSDYNLLDIQKVSDDTSPVLLVAIGENKDDGTSSTLFIVDDDGIGTVTLASDKIGTYRKDDGLTLDKNVISVSLDITNSNKKTEIHDFKVTVTKDSKLGTVYTNNETIRDE